VAIGAFFSVALAGSAGLTLVLAAIGDSLGRRRSLLLCSGLMAAAGLAFLFSPSALLLIAASLTGTINPTSAETGPFETIEAAILPQVGANVRRNTLFGWYHASGALALALGSLAAGAFGQTTAVDSLPVFRIGFLLYCGLAAVSALALSRLTRAVELHGPRPARPLPLWRSRGVVARLSALFALDAVGGGFVVQSLVVYWFSVRFGAGAGVLGPVFFGVNLLKGVSYIAAVRLADRIGLVNTMVFTHLPSNVLLLLLPFMPTLPLAVACLWARHALAQMDVPTRASYLMAVVDPGERTAANGVTSVVRSVAHAVSPALAGLALQAAASSAPFLLAGGLKVLYDLGLYLGFRRLKPEEEVAR
jgi:MFS family permease